MQHSAPNLSNLTALRGITALLVAVYHFEDLFARFIPENISMFFSKCYLMVDVFFIMSGFIITHVYQEKFRDGVNSGDFRVFIIARFARVYPMHLLALLIILASFMTSGAEPDDIQNPAAILSNLLLIHSFGIHDSFTWNVPSWSISAEWWSYLLFPFLIFCNRKWKVTAKLSLLVLVVFAYVAMMYWLPRSGPLYPLGKVTPSDLNVTFDYGYLRGLSGFVVGMILYSLYEIRAARLVLGTDWVAFAFSAMMLGGLHWAVPDIVMIPVFAGLVISTASNEGVVHSIFQWRPLQFVGDISYSIYMLHVIVIFTTLEIFRVFGISMAKREGNLVDFWPGLLGCIAFLLVVIFLSWITYLKVEKPCRNSINRMSLSKAAS